MNVQIIEKNGHPEWAIIPYKEFEVIQDSGTSEQLQFIV